MSWILLAVAGAYQLIALLAALRHLARRDPEPPELPGVSILKPVHGLDDGFYEAIRSHAALDYPDYEVLFGTTDATDAAIPEIERLIHECPRMRLLVCPTGAPNRKVGVLAALAAAARHPVLVVNDSDIRVPRDYLRRVMLDARSGMVTCLYRARGATWPGRIEAVGIATDFAPSVLVAPLFGVSEFALGSTLVFRAKDLARIGGFAAIADYLADDYQLSRRIGRPVRMSRCVVETSLPDATWASVWRHQVRWARTIRVSRGGGYLGLPVTFATLWALVLAAAGHAWGAAALFGLRAAAGLVTARLVLGDTLRYAWLMPLRDLAGVAVWVAGLFGSEVVWRDQRMRLSRDGRIHRRDAEAQRTT